MAAAQHAPDLRILGVRSSHTPGSKLRCKFRGKGSVSGLGGRTRREGASALHFRDAALHERRHQQF